MDGSSRLIKACISPALLAYCKMSTYLWQPFYSQFEKSVFGTYKNVYFPVQIVLIVTFCLEWPIVFTEREKEESLIDKNTEIQNDAGVHPLENADNENVQIHGFPEKVLVGFH